MIRSYEKHQALRNKVVKEGTVKFCGDDYIGVGLYGADINVNRKLMYVIYGYEPNDIVVYVEDDKDDIEEILVLTINSICYKKYSSCDEGLYGVISRDIQNLLR